MMNPLDDAFGPIMTIESDGIARAFETIRLADAVLEIMDWWDKDEPSERPRIYSTDGQLIEVACIDDQYGFFLRESYIDSSELADLKIRNGLQPNGSTESLVMILLSREVAVSRQLKESIVKWLKSARRR